MSRKILSSALILALAFQASAQEYLGTDPVGTVSYALPQTVIRLEVKAERESFYAGPYARYAQKYLGIDARQSDEVTCRVTDIRLSALSEADQSRRFLITPGKGVPTFLALTTQGLVSFGGGAPAEGSWRFPADGRGDFSAKGISSNLTSSNATLYRNEKQGIVAVQQQMVVEKSLEARAKEAADMIFKLRSMRVGIVIGDTDATYSGEAMGAAIEEITRLEKEYMTLFTGYSDVCEQQMNYDIVPSKDNKNQLYIAFRLSDSEGLVPAEDVSGKPYLLELKPQKIVSPAPVAVKQGKGQVGYYRIPAVCDVQLKNGASVLLQSRIPVYQLGIESSMPVNE